MGWQPAGRDQLLQVAAVRWLGHGRRDGAGVSLLHSVFRTVVAGPEAQSGFVAQDCPVADCHALPRFVLADAAGVHLARAANTLGLCRRPGAGRDLAMVFCQAAETAAAAAARRTETRGGHRES